MNSDIDRAAREQFGLDYLFPYQRLVLTNILMAAGDDPERGGYGRQIVVLPTGAGKSLCFQLPAKLIGGLTVVVYPLLSLINDQERRLRAAGFACAQLRGGLDAAQKQRLSEQLRSGAVELLLTNPESLATPWAQRALADVTVDHLVIDEAHCISEWGDSFRPAYLTLQETAASIAARCVTAFTATAGDRVLARIRQVVFSERGAHVIRANIDRSNIGYAVLPTVGTSRALRELFAPSVSRTPTGDRSAAVVWEAGVQLQRPAVVFCRSRAETLVRSLRLRPWLPGVPVYHYHAGLTAPDKQAIERAFFDSDDAVLFATCAYGMGVDKPNVRSVVHTYIPDTREAFLQESGRGGRDRKPACSLVIARPADMTWRCTQNSQPRAPVHAALLGDSCIRSSITHRMGPEPEHCSGCDVCRRTRPAPVTAYMLQQAVETMRSTADRVVRQLCDRQDLVSTLEHGRGPMLFRNWSSAEIGEAIDELMEAQLITTDRRGRLRATGYGKRYRRSNAPAW